MADISSYHEVCAGLEGTFHHYVVVRIGGNPETLGRDNKIGGSPEPPHYSRGFLFAKTELRSSEYFYIFFEKRFGDEASKILRHRQVQNQCGCALGAQMGGNSNVCVQDGPNHSSCGALGGNV